MGTLKTRHNQGRKRRTFRDLGDGVVMRSVSPAAANREAPTHGAAKAILERPRYYDGLWLDNGRTWSSVDLGALETLCSANANIEKVANALARKPSALVHRALELRLEVPQEWRSVLPTYIQKPRVPAGPSVVLQFPYILKKRDEHADILALNALVPRSIPHHMRSDICQEMMLAILEGQTTIEALKAGADKGARWFVSRFYKNNFEQSGRSVSLSGKEDDDRSYDEIASGIAAREWQQSEMNDKRLAFDSVSRRFQPAPQLGNVYRNQILGEMRLRHEYGESLSFDETADLVDAGEFLGPRHDGGTEHVLRRAKERQGLTLSPEDVRHMERKIGMGDATTISNYQGHYLVAVQGKRIPVQYSKSHRRITTVYEDGMI